MSHIISFFRKDLILTENIESLIFCRIFEAGPNMEDGFEAALRLLADDAVHDECEMTLALDNNDKSSCHWSVRIRPIAQSQNWKLDENFDIQEADERL